MTRKATQGWIGGAGFLLVLLWVGTVAAQTYTSGSTGALGAFSPSSNTTVALPADGILNYTTFTVLAGVTVSFTPNSANTPVTLLATGDVTITGTLSVNGFPGATSGGNPPSPGGAGGPGGFAGGRGGFLNATAPPMGGLGPGGGGITTGDGLAGTYNVSCACFGLLPLFGGSGGGGGVGGPGYSGPSGGGGGGAIVIASSTKITVSGSITANGGARASILDGLGSPIRSSGSGSGGAIRLIAPQIIGGGTVNAAGGFIGGGNGVIRLETFNFGFSGTITPSPSVSFVPGPVTAASNPALINLPTLVITSVGGVAVPSNPTGSLTSADVSLPSGTTNPVTVTLTATNTTKEAIFTVRLIPQNGGASTGNNPASRGSFASST